jgi:hypothetical protein
MLGKNTYSHMKNKFWHQEMFKILSKNTTFEVRRDHFVELSWLFCKTNIIPLILFRSELRNGLFRVPRNALGMSTFFRGITESIPSLFRGIFSERNSVANPILC